MVRPKGAVAVAELRLGFYALLLAANSVQKTCSDAAFLPPSTLNACLVERTGEFCNSHCAFLSH
jgi:hypothetical protein